MKHQTGFYSNYERGRRHCMCKELNAHMVVITEVRKAHIELDGANHGVEEHQRIQSSDKYLSMGRVSWSHN